MSDTNEFTGLPMPVFTAFGWAGEETAIQFALSQLEMFVESLNSHMPKNLQVVFPHYGLSPADRTVYISAEPEPEKDIHVLFNARPTSFELQLGLSNKAALAKGLKQAVKQPALIHRLITELGPDWSLRIQQMQYDPDSEQATHYQDLFKDSVSRFLDDTAVSIFEKAEYLNSEEKWVTPIALSYRFNAEQVAAMGIQILDVIVEHIEKVMPVVTFLTDKTGKVAAKSSRQRSRKKSATNAKVAQIETAVDDAEEQFEYITTLKPLHLRRGFINLTPAHWPFFSINSRTETRKVTIYYEGIYDKNSAVWRMVPNDRARIVLSPAVHDWLESSFNADEDIHVIARKISSSEIQISLKHPGE